ncbi:MAG: CAP domain-containing protein [Syntrophobacteraceae bacterium]|nr:CAP domain-containing protein [Syntrophobacteraceae bacterium]
MKSGFCAAAIVLCLLFSASAAHAWVKFTPNSAGSSDAKTSWSGSTPGDLPGLRTASGAVVRQRIAQFCPDALLSRSHVESIDLPLFDDLHLTAIERERQSDRNGFLLWTGDIEGPRGGKLVLVVRDGLIFASVYLPSSIIQIRPIEAETGRYSRDYIIRQLAYPGKIQTAPDRLCPSCGSQAGLTPGARRMIELVNLERKADGLPVLQYSGMLTEAASRHGRDMAVHDLCSHELSGGEPFYKSVFGAGYPVSEVAENIAVGLATAEQTFESIFSSSEHRPNLLNRHFTQIGVSAVFNKASTYQYFWAMELGAGEPNTAKAIRLSSNGPPS